MPALDVYRVRSRGLQMAAVALLLSSAPGFADTATPQCDSYLLYYVHHAPSGYFGLRLSDQFLASATAATSLWLFGEPVGLNGEPVIDLTTHYTGWEIRPDSFDWGEVFVENEFGEQRLVLGPAALLMNPARQAFVGGSQPLKNHYKCYRAAGLSVKRDVVVGSSFTTPVAATVLGPTFFCNPVKKDRVYPDGTVEVNEIIDGSLHYVCYGVGGVDLGPTLGVRAYDQFGSFGLSLFESQLSGLCVPSKMTGFVPTRAETWGGLKAFYR